MHSVSIAEWIVGQFVCKNRAASIVGDLLEQKPQNGLMWFWLSIAGIVVALVWRRLLAFIAAFYAGTWAIGGFQMQIVGIHAQHRPPEHPWMQVFMMLCPAATFLLFLLVYAAIRYGFRDQVTQLALALTTVATAIIYCWWQPAVLVACLVLSVCILVASVLNVERLRAAMVLLVVVVVGFGGGLLAMYLDAKYQHFVYTGPLGDRELQEHPSVLWMGFCAVGITAWMMTTACSFMHDRLMRDRDLNSET